MTDQIRLQSSPVPIRYWMQPQFWLPSLILLGVIFSLAIQTQIPDEVYFSGDGGLKALMTRQFSAGQWRLDLALPVPSWARQLWQTGFFPFPPPFAYAKNGGYFITFPIIFPFLSAPFYHLFGSKGLCLLPLFATSLIWVKFYRLCRGFELSERQSAAALAGLIFASPLTLYSAMFWEHAPAVALAFWGVATILESTRSGITPLQALFSGTLIGFAAWFRPEFLCFGTVFGGVVLVVKLRGLRQYDFLPHHHFPFLIGLIGLIGLFLGFNWLAYGYPLGIHGLQFIESSPSHRVWSSLANVIELTWRFGLYFPIALFPLIALASQPLRRRWQAEPIFGVLLAIGVLFTLGTAIIISDGAGGKQWGSRFLLILVPLMGFLAAMLFFQEVEVTERRSQVLRRIGLTLGLVSFGLNTVFGGVKVGYDYQHNVLPMLKLLQQDPIVIVVATNQIAVQELYPGLYGHKIFFTADADVNSQIKLEQLMLALAAQGEQQFLLVQYHSEYVPSLTYALKASATPVRVQLTELGRRGLYVAYRGLMSMGKA